MTGGNSRNLDKTIGAATDVHHAGRANTHHTMQSIQTAFWFVLAVLFLVGLPIMLVWSMVDYFRGKESDRRGSGSFTAGVGAAMQELDRVMARPSVEHIVEAENPVLRREDDSGTD